jgi:multisubunit Na+/H+ antiporter MnhB subunit
MRRKKMERDNDGARVAAGGRGSLLVTAVAAGLLGCYLVYAVLDLEREPAGLTASVLAELNRTGAAHPVTAVLLNFRAYDTWLELGVLLLGMLGVFVLRRQPGLGPAPGSPAASAVLGWLVGRLLPMMVLVGGYLLWLGKFAAGGAFQAGVVLGVAGVLLWLAGFPSAAGLPAPTLRIMLVSGFAGFLVVALLTAMTGRIMLDFPEGASGLTILALESLATVSIGITITALLIGLQPGAETRTAL